MKILRWWKRIPLSISSISNEPIGSIDIVYPVREITDKQPFFDEIVSIIHREKYLSYELVEVTEKILKRRDVNK